MSVTPTSPVSSGAESDDLAALFSDAALEQAAKDFYAPRPSSEASPAPSDQGRAAAPAETAPEAPPAKAEQAPVTPAPAAEAKAETPAEPPARTTYPKSWKGTEEEWQAFRAEQNRARDREANELRAAREREQQLADRLAILEAQIATRDTTYADTAREFYLRQGYAPEQAEELVQRDLAADRQRGNDRYVTERDQRARQAQIEAERQRGELTVQEAAQKQAELDARITYSNNLLPLQQAAIRAGLDDLDVNGLLEEALTSDDLAPLVESTYVVPEQQRQRLVERIYKDASRMVRERIAEAKAAHDAATAPKEDTTKGRQTVLGAPVGHNIQQDWSDDAVIGNIDDYYKSRPWEQTRAAP